jgi:hypothetical protein
VSEAGCWLSEEMPPAYREFASRRDGMIHAMDGGLWLHRHVWKGTPMAHLVSTDRLLLLEYGHGVGLPASRLQFKPLKDPRTGRRRDTWHWDLIGRFLPAIRVSQIRITRTDVLWIDPHG